MADTGQEALSGQAGPAVDPTRNVLDLVAAAITRQDDRREDLEKLFNANLIGLRELMISKFEAVQAEFSQVEASRKEQKSDTRTAVDAALSAAEKAVKEQASTSEKATLKSETDMKEQTRLTAATFTAQLASLDAIVSDVKERIGKIENVKLGSTETKSGQNANISVIISVASALIALVAVILGVMK